MIFFGKKRFNELLESVEGINSKTLALRIREMESAGLIKRKVFNEMPLRVEYELTERALKLRPLLEQMGDFSTQFCAGDIFKDKRPRSFPDLLESQIEKSAKR